MHLKSVSLRKGLVFAFLAATLVCGALVSSGDGGAEKDGKDLQYLWGIGEWAPIPERMWSKDFVAIFEAVPKLLLVQDGKVRNETLLAELTRIEAQHSTDKDVLVLATYIRAMFYGPEDIVTAKQTTAKLMTLARQDLPRYSHFEKCGEHLQARLAMIEAPTDVEQAKASLAELLQEDVNTDAVGISITGVVRVIEKQNGPGAAVVYLQQVAEAHPATMAAFHSWGRVATLNALQGQWERAEAAVQEQIKTAQARGDERLVRHAQGTSKMWKYARDRAAKSDDKS